MRLPLLPGSQPVRAAWPRAERSGCSASTPPRGGRSRRFAFRRGSLSVAVGEGAVGVGSLAHRASRIEPSTNAMTVSVPVATRPRASPSGTARSGPPSAVTPCGGSTRRRRLTGTVPRAVPSGVAIGEGSIWVASYGDGTVSRIDPLPDGDRHDPRRARRGRRGCWLRSGVGGRRTAQRQLSVVGIRIRPATIRCRIRSTAATTFAGTPGLIRPS